MTLPASGAISFGQVDTELGLSSTALITLNDAAVRTLAGVGGSGTTISLDNLHGKTYSTYHRPTTYTPTNVTGGSIINPTSAYDGSSITLDGSTWAAILHNKSGPVDVEEVCTYSGFGTGTFSGYLKLVINASCSDTSISAQSVVGIDVNGTTIASLSSNLSGHPVTASYPTTSPISYAVTGINLATFTVAIWSIGGQYDSSDYCSSNINACDIILVP